MENEIFGFLSHQRLDVRNQAVQIVAGLTSKASNHILFATNNYSPIDDLKTLCKDEPLTAHDALSALTNLSADVLFANVMADKVFLRDLVTMMLIPTNINADICCMLLNNLSKHPSIADHLLPIKNKDEGEGIGTQLLDNLLEVFVRGETSIFNPDANFHFLAGVFANISASPQGCQFFLSNSTVDKSHRLSKLIIFTEHSSLIRRGGVISTLKNVCFGSNLEMKGLELNVIEQLNFLSYILLPLSGPEDYEIEEMEGMPSELQLLEPEKQRESDVQLRIMLLEILIALGTTATLRQYLRKIKVYEVVKKAHLQESNEVCQELITELVNLLMRDETDIQ